MWKETKQTKIQKQSEENIIKSIRDLFKIKREDESINLRY